MFLNYLTNFCSYNTHKYFKPNLIRFTESRVKGIKGKTCGFRKLPGSQPLFSNAQAEDFPRKLTTDWVCGGSWCERKFRIHYILSWIKTSLYAQVWGWVLTTLVFYPLQAPQQSLPSLASSISSACTKGGRFLDKRVTGQVWQAPSWVACVFQHLSCPLSLTLKVLFLPGVKNRGPGAQLRDWTLFLTLTSCLSLWESYLLLCDSVFSAAKCGKQ